MVSAGCWLQDRRRLGWLGFESLATRLFGVIRVVGFTQHIWSLGSVGRKGIFGMGGFTDGLTRLIRVGVSGAWAWLAMFLMTRFGIEFSVENSNLILAGLMVFTTAIVNALVAWLTAILKSDRMKSFMASVGLGWFNPEWLLGWGRSPVYVHTEDVPRMKRMAQ